VALFQKKSEDERSLVSARADLTAAQKKRAILAASESAAAVSADKYEMWCAERDAADIDVNRLTKRVAALEAAIAETARTAAEAEIRRQIDICRAANTAIASRLKDEGARAILTLKTLARDAAAAAAEAQRLNAILPPGIDPIAIGDFMARDLPRLPREEIATEIQHLWVNSHGVPVGDQDAVVQGKDGKGSLQVNRTTHMFCTKRKFRSTTFRPAFVANHPGHFFAALRLPFPDRPGLAFDGSATVLQQVATLDVDLPPPPKQVFMPARTELVPIDPWPPVGVVTEAERGAA
jgi:hypothetical protein